LTVAFLQTRQSAKPRFCELERYKAAIGDLTQSAISGLSDCFQLLKNSQLYQYHFLRDLNWLTFSNQA
jgi:hypothetical protein